MEQEQNLNFESEQPTVDKNGPRGQAITSMILGILSIVLGSIPGIVLACIARAKANEFLTKYPESSYKGFANAGRITGNIGLPIAIVSLVLSLVFTLIYGFVYDFVYQLVYDLIFDLIESSI